LINKNKLSLVKFKFIKSNLTMEFHVPTLGSKEKSTELKEVILTAEPDADINIDLDSKKIMIESEASAETFKQLIVAAGHKISEKSV
jgi:copper chaperone